MNYLFSFLFLLILNSSFILNAQDENPCERIKNKKAIKLYDQAKTELKNRNKVKANQLLREAIEIESDFFDAYYLLGEMSYKRAKADMESQNISNTGSAAAVKSAKKYLRKSIELCPTYNPYAYFYLGQIYFGADQYDSAYYYFNEFTKDAEKIKSTKDYDDAEQMAKYAKDYTNVKSKTVPFKPYPVKGISTKFDEYLAIISADNQIALFTRKDTMPAKKTVYGNDSPVFKEKFMISNFYGGEYDRGKSMPPPFNKNDNEGGATLSLQNDYLIYTVSKPIGNYLNTDLYYSKLTNGVWSEIKSLGPKINLPDSWESQPSLSSDGKTLYFASNRKGGLGGIDIYKSTRDDSGEWGMPVNLGPTINTMGDEKSPFIHTDNITLYFSSSGLPGLGGYDIFYCKQDANGKFFKPKNIGYPINSEGDDIGFFVSTDGKKGFFCTNRKGLIGMGGWDVFSFDLYEEARPEAVLLVAGSVKDETTNEFVRAKVELKNVETKQITEIDVDTLTGKYITAVLFKNDFVLSVKKEGYAYESKYIAKDDTTFASPSKVDMDIQPLVLGKAYELKDIKYGINSAELTDNSKTILNDFIEFLTNNPELKVAIHGHTDDVGDDQTNLKLSDDRAKSVYEYLINNNIASSRLSYKGFGETMPIATNKTAAGRAKNRRTEFVIIKI